MMDREKMIENIRHYLQYMITNEMPEYKYGLYRQETSDVLCPLFGYLKNGKNTANIRIDFNPTVGETVILIYPQDSNGFKFLQPKQLTYTQLEGLQELMRQCVVKHYKETQYTQSNPKLKEILPELEKWAKKCVKAAGRDYTAHVDFGKRANDTGKSPYHAIVVEKQGTQVGTIPLRQDRYGKLTHNVQIPLCGEWDKDMELRMDNCFTLVRKGIESIVGKHLVVGSLAERIALEKKIVEQKTKELKYLTDLKVQIQEYNSWLPMSERNCDRFEHWNLEFEHGFNNMEEPFLKLNAWKGHGAKRIDMDLGRAKLDLKNPEERIVLTVLDDNYPELTAALMKTGKAKSVGEYTKRHKDYPGADETEVFHYKRMDVTDFYRQYIQLRNAQYLFSPITDIRLVCKGDNFDLTPKNWISIKLGGLSDLADKCDRQTALTLKQFKNEPLYHFLLQDMAHKKFAPEIDLLKDAMQRITDIEIRQGNLGAYISGPFIRCRIDDEQQMSLSIGHELRDRCNEAVDPELAECQLAALFYQKDLAEKHSEQKGMKR